MVDQFYVGSQEPTGKPIDDSKIDRVISALMSRSTERGNALGYIKVIKDPYPHILVSSKKQIHGWWRGKRECTGERMLLNPYNGCSVGCIFCYARALPGPYFKLFDREGIVTVFEDFDRVIARQIDSISVASCGYLSPVSDPFQEVNKRYMLSEKIVEVFVTRNIPIEFVTKCVVPDRVISMIAKQRHSFGQFSLSTIREELRSNLMSGGATVDQIFESMVKCATVGIPVVLRIDPVIPYLTDSEGEIRELIQRGIDSGAKHIVGSVMDVPIKIANEVFAKFKLFGVGFVYDLERLYKERIGNYLHASVDYRKRIFDRMRNLCDRLGATFALCMEYEVTGREVIGLNREFMSSRNCEGVDVPVYVRKGDRFEPSCDCDGACLRCLDARCGIEDLAMGKGVGRKDFTLKDYRRWSKGLGVRDA